MSVGENIKYYRKQKGLTQKKLAELTGIAEITIRQYESGKYEPKTENLYKIRKHLDVNIHQLLDNDPDTAYTNINNDIEQPVAIYNLLKIVGCDYWIEGCNLKPAGEQCLCPYDKKNKDLLSSDTFLECKNKDKMCQYYVIKYNNKTINMSQNSFEKFENDILSYTKFKLSELFKTLLLEE